MIAWVTNLRTGIQTQVNIYLFNVPGAVYMLETQQPARHTQRPYPPELTYTWETVKKEKYMVLHS